MSTEVHDVVGYVTCLVCQDQLVITPVAGRTGGLCLDCFRARGNKPLRVIEIEARGTRIPIPLGRPQRVRKKVKTPEAKARDRVVDKCKERAMKRLRAVFPDLYDILLAEERAAAGLDPWPLGTALRSGPDPDGSQTADFAAIYHALQDRGVDV